MPQDITDSYETDLDEIDGLEWWLGSVDVSNGMVQLDVTPDGDEGFDDNGDVDSDDHAAPMDGVIPGQQRLGSREVSVTVSISHGPPVIDDDNPAHAALANTLHDLRLVTSLLPDRRATRVLRFRRLGEEGKRLYVRPPRGKSLTVPGDDARLKSAHANRVVVRMEAPEPTIYSDALHSITFNAGETLEIPNAGSFTSKAPLIPWTLDAEGTVTLTHEDFDEEIVTFPSSGHLHVSHAPGTQDFEIAGHNTYGICFGPGGRLRPNLPLLRPGVNNITASAACTITWRDTW